MTAMKLPQFIETIASFVVYKAQRSYKTRHRANGGDGIDEGRKRDPI